MKTCFLGLKIAKSNFEKANLKNIEQILGDATEEIKKLNKNYERVLVVSHGATLKTLLHYISGKDISTLSDEEIPKNTSYTIVEYKDGKFEITDFSNTSHLDEIK